MPTTIKILVAYCCLFAHVCKHLLTFTRCKHGSSHMFGWPVFIYCATHRRIFYESDLCDPANNERNMRRRLEKD